MKTWKSRILAISLAGALGASAQALNPALARETPHVRLPQESGNGHAVLVQNYPDPANPGRRPRAGDPPGYSAPFLPLESIIAGIQARVPGRLVGVQGPNSQGIYRIVWETTDGRVITFVVDARTGQILR